MLSDPQPAFIYKSHPEKKGVMQKFATTVTKDEEGRNVITLSDPLGDYRKAEPGEKGDCNIYSHSDTKVVAYVKI